MPARSSGSRSDRRKRPTFLTLDEALALHADQIDRYGGSVGVRDVGLLEAALATPQASFGGEYLHDGLAEIAAAYLFHLARNHPFVDGNKRVALAAAIAFLGLNGFWLDADPDDLADRVLRVAQGDMPKAELAEYIRKHALPWED
jgi:death-on-curing protein